MAKELEKSKSKVMEFDNKLKQEQKNLEEAESETLKYKSQMGEILEHQSLSQENIIINNQMIWNIMLFLRNQHPD